MDTEVRAMTRGYPSPSKRGNTFMNDHLSDIIHKPKQSNPWSSKPTSDMSFLTDKVIEKEKQNDFSNYLTETPMYRDVINAPLYKPPTMSSPRRHNTSRAHHSSTVSSSLLPDASKAANTSAMALAGTAIRDSTTLALPTTPYRGYKGPDRAGGGGLARLNTKIGANSVHGNSEEGMSLNMTSAMQHSLNYTPLQRALTEDMRQAYIKQTQSNNSNVSLPINATTVRLHSAAAALALEETNSATTRHVPAITKAKDALSMTQVPGRPSTQGMARPISSPRRNNDEVTKTARAHLSQVGLRPFSSASEAAKIRAPPTFESAHPLTARINTSQSAMTASIPLLSFTQTRSVSPTPMPLSMAPRVLSSRVLSAHPGSVTDRLADKQLVSELQRRQALPRLDVPQRVIPPAFMSVPQRTDDPGKDLLAPLPATLKYAAHKNAQTERKYASARLIESDMRGSAGSNRRSYEDDMITGVRRGQQAFEGHQIVMKKVIQDYTLRAQACARAGRVRGEANAHFCIGLLYDNLRLPSQAIVWYHKFLNVAQSASEKILIGLAHNVLGISYSQMGHQYIDKALHHHVCHRDIADLLGSFQANTNIGILLSQQARYSEAAAAHKLALDASLEMDNVSSQIISAGNLGIAAFDDGNMDAAQACLEQHLKLTDLHPEFMCEGARSNAFFKLGEIAHTQHQLDRAIALFQAALDNAVEDGDWTMASKAKVALGMTHGAQKAETRLRNLGQSMSVNRNNAYIETSIE